MLKVLPTFSVYPDASEEVSHILAKKLMGNGEIEETSERTDSTSSSPSSWNRKESLNQLLKLQQMSKVPKLKGEVNSLIP
jgi:hypothetical protein